MVTRKVTRAPKTASASKPTTPAKIAAMEERADDLLGRVHQQLFPLGDFGLNAAKIPCEFNSLRQAVDGLCERAAQACLDAAKELPEQHPAGAHLVNAVAALDGLKSFMDMADESSEAETAKPTRRFLSLVGRGILQYTAECGRHCERAELLLDPEGHITTGYLDGYLIDCDDEGRSDMKRCSDEEHSLLHTVRRLDQARRAAIASAANELLAQQNRGAA